MAAPVDVANRAIVLLGAARISDLNDDVKAAREIKAVYDVSRQVEIRKNRWGFCMKRAQLPAIAAVPPATSPNLFGYVNAYNLPADCLGVDMVGDVFLNTANLENFRASGRAAYAIEQRQILTDQGGPLNIRYKADITNVNIFDACFVEVLAHKLAIMACTSITESSGKLGDLRKGYLFELAEARKANAIERPPELLPDNSWLASRL
jgi:hypothetical protein